MTKKANEFQVTSKINLKKIPTSLILEKSDKKMEKELKKVRRELGDLQNILYAYGKYSVLVCIQGMDTSGKDSLIREVFKDFNIRGVIAHSFKKPTKLELKHDFLWRHYKVLPDRGKYAVFNRSHYENIIIARVHPEIILRENIPHINSVEDITEEFWTKRIHQIKNFENTISSNGCIIFKFYLHISKEEQKRRLLRRLNKPNKNWKFAPEDMEERKLWEEYIQNYEKAINETSTKNAPWYVIPSDHKDQARLLVAKILKEKMSTYKDIQNPSLPPHLEMKLDEYKKILKE
ncbi:polyphosphate kinase 2 family protein [Psychroflexus gondwanensis]|jgi:PPK2 family polyphosphate:nucleotide phosphotransferase|uniref:PPK2 family polyphosphate kinase n=1 Tax=Psychroflexus gondwanensis TaxID=251 RepID=UPI0011BFA150|nr:PPK2 family polyphosphate kinase [Psychroflexus gondwanensis]TXE18951.1 polyphosphate kinase 2 family protein [Psychroflexus gondwanensis]